ncbi:MAG: ribosome biogenesis GTP-binding protein YihA/YsxC [Myxococcota bacterium]|nr:ribosome biogenesis GTP-binding protein YihA/YsxC [Myxococcota bacterium]
MKLNRVEFIRSATAPAHFPPADRPEVAFGGRSNVGKSSLLNVLMQRHRLVKVSKTPGCTQTINFFDVNDALYLVDLPGYGFAKVPASVQRMWGPMIGTYFEKRRSLMAVAALLDVRREPSEGDLLFANMIREAGKTLLVVMTKCDKLGSQEIERRRREIARTLRCEAPIAFSSERSLGRDELWKAIKRATWDFLPEGAGSQSESEEASSPLS